MSSSTTILEDQSKLSLADRTYFKLESSLNLLGGIIIILLVLFATVNVLGRWLFDLPISGYIDWVEQSMAFMAFLGIAYTQREGGHIRMADLAKKYNESDELQNAILMANKLDQDEQALSPIAVIVAAANEISNARVFILSLHIYVLPDYSVDCFFSSSAFFFSLSLPIRGSLVSVQICEKGLLRILPKL